jgi:hypothetical protein
MSPPSSANASKFIEPIECNECGASAYVILRTSQPDVPLVVGPPSCAAAQIHFEHVGTPCDNYVLFEMPT